jgi:hypothetical protein
MSNTVQNQVREFKTTSTCQIRQIKDSTHNVVCHLVCEVVETSMGSNLRVVDISPQGGFRVQTCRSGFFHFVYKPDLQQIVEPALPFDYVSRLVAQVLYSSGPTRQKTPRTDTSRSMTPSSPTRSDTEHLWLALFHGRHFNDDTLSIL